MKCSFTAFVVLMFGLVASPAYAALAGVQTFEGGDRGFACKMSMELAVKDAEANAKQFNFMLQGIRFRYKSCECTDIGTSRGGSPNWQCITYWEFDVERK